MLLSDKDTVKFLNAIDTGKITLYCPQDPLSIYAGNVLYEASNGWHITVFNDCNEWDYIDNILTNDGRFLDFGQLNKHHRTDRWAPNKATLWWHWGIPGYLNHRRECWHGCNPTKEMVELADLNDRIQLWHRSLGYMAYDYMKYCVKGKRHPEATKQNSKLYTPANTKRAMNNIIEEIDNWKKDASKLEPKVQAEIQKRWAKLDKTHNRLEKLVK